MKNSADYISLDKLYYTQENKIEDEDALFEKALKEFKLEPAFEYQMSLFKEENNTHIFLTHIQNLSSKNFLYPQVLIFKPLAEKIQKNHFAVLVFENNFSFLAFYQNASFYALKNLPQCTLLELETMDTKQREEFFLKLLEQGRILELLRHYKSEALISFNDHFNFKTYLKNDMRTFDLKDFYSEESLKKLSELSVYHLKAESNFIKTLKKERFTLKIFGFFILIFFISLGFLALKDYPVYQENQKIKLNNEKLQDNFSDLSKEEEKLKKEIKNLELSLKEQEGKTNLKQELLAEVVKERDFENKSFILAQFIKILNQEQIQISFLKIQKTQLSFKIVQEKDFQKTLKLFENNKEFKILKQDLNSKEFILEYLNG